MGNLRKVVGISLAVAVALGLVAYLLVPHAGPSNESVVVNQPQAPTTGGGNSTASGTSHTGTSGTSTPTAPHIRQPKLHGKNSEGPKHVICLPVNAHVQGTAQYQGANWYRGQCAQTAGANSQGHANGHGQNIVLATELSRSNKDHGL